MTAGLLGMAARASLSAGVMILVVVLLRRQFQSRTPRRVFCLLWDMVLCRLLILSDIPSPVSVQRLLALGQRSGGEAAARPVSFGLISRMMEIPSFFPYPSGECVIDAYVFRLPGVPARAVIIPHCPGCRKGNCRRRGKRKAVY